MKEWKILFNEDIFQFVWFFVREREHLECDWKTEMIEYLMLSNRQYRGMNTVHIVQSHLQWDLECLIIICVHVFVLSNTTYPIAQWILPQFPWHLILVSEGRSNHLSKHNSHFNSTYFSLLMCCHNYFCHWLFYFYDHHHKEHHNHQ